MKSQIHLFRRLILAALALALTGQACTLSLFQNPFGNTSPTSVPQVTGPTPTPQPTASTTFIAILPEPLQSNESLVLAILDEVTGLPLNPTMNGMSPRDALTYTVTLPFIYGATVKYRYIRQGGSQIAEDANSGAAIRYRMAHIAGPGEVTDIINDWADKAYARSTGTILGQVFNSDTGSPLPNMLVTAAGVQSITDSAGRFELPGLPIGTHNLLAYSLDGMYQTFQQGAVVADNQTTIVDLRIKPAQMVNVTFVASIPSTTVPGVPVRVAGNLLQLGNTFADLQGGINTIADRMPIMSLQADGRYATTLALPIGTHIQYKYTLGDGYWNAEHANNGAWVLREFIVPPQDLILQDNVATWAAGDSAPILFEVNVPSVTPSGDIIYIQFNTFGWTEPVPMWPLGSNKWAYKLYSPFNTLGAFHYRYCRNGQCGSADDAQTEGASHSGRKVITSITAQDLKDTVNVWKWYENPEPVALVGTVIIPRAGGFIAGIEFQPTYRPNWFYFAPQTLVNTQALGTNMVIFTPTWSYTKVSPLQFTTVPGQDPLWIDSAIMISQARALGLNTAIFPVPNFSPASSSNTDFWMNAPRDAQWWQTWFTRYRAFIVNYADLAAQTGSQTLILGGDWITPALPNGKLPDGASSNPPADADAQWNSIITDVRARFKGQILWALPYTKASLEAPLNFLQNADGIYLLWSAKLSSNPSATKIDYANEAGQLLDNEVAALSALLKKPVILAIAYPSANGAAAGCIPGACPEWSALSRPNADVNSVNLNLQMQADLYEAMLIAVNARPWISGFVSRGFYPPAALQDKSTSVHSKPTADILWYWYPRLTGAVR